MRADEPAASPRLPATFGDWLTVRPSVALPTPGATLHYTYDGQSALYQAFAALRPRYPGRVLVPAYHCPTVVEPILRAGYAIDYYDIQLDLRRPARPFSELVTPAHAVVVVINYFGFAFDVSSLPGDGPLLVEDCCHSFLHGSGTALSGHRGDLAIFSFKKLLPCYTGGAIRYNRADLPRPPPARAVPLRRQLAHARQVLSDSLTGSSWPALRALNPPAARAALTGPVALPPLEQAYPFPTDSIESTMPPLARRMLAHADLVACARARQAHYQRVAECLQEVAVIERPLPDIDRETCPWGYPILLPDRAAVDYQLSNLGVPFNTFGEQLHPTLRAVAHDFPVAATLSSRLLFLATHQALNAVQVERYCAAIVSFFATVKDR